MADAFGAVGRRLRRFVGIGVLNTLIDLALYAMLQPYLGIVVATLVSTGVAMVFSYVANAYFAFSATELTWRSAIQFFGLSAINLWVLQPFVILGAAAAARPVIGDEYRTALVAKVASLAVSMTINFLVYDRYIWPRTAYHTNPK